MNSQVFGPGHVLLATTLFAASSVLARVAYDDGGNPLAFVTVRAAAAVGILWVWLALSAEPWKLSIRDRNHAVILGLVVTVNHFSFNISIERIPVSLAVLMFFLYPLFVTVIDVARKRERFSLRSAIAAVMTIIGIIMVIPDQPTASEVTGLLWGLLSAITWTAVLLLTAQWFPTGDSRPRTLYMFVTVFAVSLILALVTRSAAWPDSVGGAAAVMGGSLAYALGLMGIFITMAALGPGRTAFYLNFEPLAVLILAAMVLGQTMAKAQLLGAFLVIAALFLFRLPAAKFALGRRR
jgi:drug/metabolite transporter (DMT)-like permease